MTAAKFFVRLGLHALTATIGLVLGLTLPLTDGALDGLAALVGVGALTVIVGATGETWSRARRSRFPAEDGSSDVMACASDQLARRDALTGLPNRQALLERLRAILDQRRRSGRQIAVLALDLVDFRAITARLGCSAGDLLLRHASARLLAALRESDTLARISAARFAIVQNEVDTPHNAATLCARLAAVLAEPFDLCGHLVRVNARIGVAVSPSDGHDPDTLLRHAGLALARAHRDEDAFFRFHEDAMDAELHARKALEADLARALERNQFEIEYQPQIDIASRRMVGVEALLRWNHPGRGRVGPDQFIPLAEDSGLIVPIGVWVLEETCAQAVRWQQAGASTLRMSVNISPVQLQDRTLPDVVGEILARSGLAPDCLELEITERVLMQDTAASLDALRRLKSLGVRISVDDFGVGHSSLNYLRLFPFDEIKVDRSFVSALEHDPSAAAIVRAALSLGRSLGMVSVAEGVESAAQLRLLDTEGCGLAQGFYFSPPVHPREIEIMVHATETSVRKEISNHESLITI